MSKEEKKNAAATQEKAEKVMTKYDRKMQKRAEEKRKEKRAKDIWTGVGVVILLALAGLVLSFPICTYLSLHQSYVNIGGEDVTKVEFDYCYHTVLNNYVSQYSQYLSWMGLDVNQDLSTQLYSSTRSWKDYFEEMTVEALRRNKALKADAKAKGFTKDVTKEYENLMEQHKASAQEAGISLNKYLQRNFGSYATAGRIKPFLEEALYVNAYYEKLCDDMTPTAEEVQAKYSESPKDYDMVDYRIKQFDAQLPTAPTELADPASETESDEGEETAYVPSEAEVNKAMSDARELANAAQTSVKTEGEQVTGTSYASTNDAIRDWLFEDGRKDGDVTVIDDKNANKVYCVAFEKRYRDETPTADVRILVADDEEQAKEIYNDWNAGGATDECFKDLCNGKYLKNSAAEDGLLEGISKDEDLYEELLDWIFADGRATGNCEIVNVPDVTSFVVYYLGQSDPKWYHTIKDTLQSTAVTEYVDNLKENCQVSDPRKNLYYLVAEEEEKKAAESAAAESSAAESTVEESSAEGSAE